MAFIVLYLKDILKVIETFSEEYLYSYANEKLKTEYNSNKELVILYSASANYHKHQRVEQAYNIQISIKLSLTSTSM